MGSDEGEGQEAEATVLGHRPSHLPRTVLVAALMGGFGGVVTVAFVRVLEGGQDLLWTDLPKKLDISSDAWYFIFAVVLVGAVLLGLARRLFGEYPLTIEDALAEHKAKGEFDYHHLGQAVLLSLISLVFGAALGPEAALTAILGGLGSWIAQVMHANETEGADVSFIGIGGALGALFGTAGAAVLTLDPRSSDAKDAKSGRLLRVLPGIAAALAGLYIYRALGSSDHYFNLGLPKYSFKVSDLGWAVPVSIISCVGGLVFLALCAGFDRLLKPLQGRHVLQSVVGGLGLAALASLAGRTAEPNAPSLVLFSGHEGVDALVQDYGHDAVRFLTLIALAKLVAAALLLAALWKGGRFFPTMFAGAALGLAMSQTISGLGEVPALAAGMTAIVGVLTQRPVLAAGLMILFFPPPAWPIVVLAAVLGGAVGKRLTPAVTGEPAEGAEPAAA